MCYADITHVKSPAIRIRNVDPKPQPIHYQIAHYRRFSVVFDYAILYSPPPPSPIFFLQELNAFSLALNTY